MCSDMERFFFESMVRGYHTYKDVWNAVVGEVLPCQRENRNRFDPFAVAVVKNRTTVGLVPKKSICSLFIRRNGTVTIRTISDRRYSADLPQGGLEIPCVITFEGAGKDVQTAKRLIEAALS